MLARIAKAAGGRRLGLAAAAAGVSLGGCALSSWGQETRLANCESMPSQRFAGKTVVITGAGGQLGREGAVFFASEGANVVAVDVSARALDDTLREVRAATPGARAIAAVCDVRSEESVEAAVAQAVGSFGRIDCLWNNAGVQGAIAPTLEYPLDDFKTVLDVNVLGAFTMLKANAQRCPCGWYPLSGGREVSVLLLSIVQGGTRDFRNTGLA